MNNVMTVYRQGVDPSEGWGIPLKLDLFPCSAEAGEKLPEPLIFIKEWQGIRLRIEYLYQKAEQNTVVEKRIRVTHLGGEPLCILKMDLGTFQSSEDEIWNGGGTGQPAFCGKFFFTAVRHPHGVVQVSEDGQYAGLSQYPGAHLSEGQTWESFAVICGISALGDATALLDEYIHGIAKFRPKPVKVYGDWALHDELGEKGRSVELTEKMTKDNVLHIKYLRDNHGIEFDYYLMDHGWYSKHSLEEVKKPNFQTEGLAWVADELRAMGMKFGLWFPVNTFFINDGIYCGLEPEEEQVDYKAYCLHSSYGLKWKKALLNAVEKWGVRFIKLDFTNLHCTQCAEHGLPLSVEEELLKKILLEQESSKLIDIVSEIHSLHPDVFFAAFNGFVISPWWVEYLDTMYIGDVQPSDVPTIGIRPSMNMFTAQRLTQYEEQYVPRDFLDDCGTFIGVTTTNFYLGKTDWRSQALLSLGRGTKVVYYYGDLSLLNEEDLRFMKSIFNEHQRYDKAFSSYTIGTPSGKEPFMYVHQDYAAVYNPTLQKLRHTWTLPSEKAKGDLEVIVELAPYEAQWIRLEKGNAVLFSSGSPLPSHLDGKRIEVTKDMENGWYSPSVDVSDGQWVLFATVTSEDGQIQKSNEPSKQCLVESNYPFTIVPDHFTWNSVGWLTVITDTSGANNGKPWVKLTTQGHWEGCQIKDESWWIS